ncbi:hypothetical protein GGI24_003509, partial [Coemansia furcata]
EKHWVDVVSANMPENMVPGHIDGLFSRRVLGEVKTLMWKPAASVEQYIVEAITTINPDDT